MRLFETPIHTHRHTHADTHTHTHANTHTHTYTHTVTNRNQMYRRAPPWVQNVEWATEIRAIFHLYDRHDSVVWEACRIRVGGWFDGHNVVWQTACRDWEVAQFSSWKQNSFVNEMRLKYFFAENRFSWSKLPAYPGNCTKILLIIRTFRHRDLRMETFDVCVQKGPSVSVESKCTLSLKLVARTPSRTDMLRVYLNTESR